MTKQAYFNTLNEALRSEHILHTWPTNGRPIKYGETLIWHHEYYPRADEVTGLTVMPAKIRRVSVFRDGVTGKYERPIHYIT